MDKGFKIERSDVGDGHPTYLIAEMSGNHNGELERAMRLVREAKSAGANAIKLQTYTADTITMRCDNEYFRIRGGTPWDGLTLYELFEQAHTPWEWQADLKALADEIGLQFFSSAFDPSSVDFLEKLGVGAYKIASFEIVDLPLIEYVAGTGKPMILSTGMSTEAEIDEALEAAARGGARGVAVLKCTSAYPAPYEEMNLKAIPTMRERFGVPVGLSDHTLGHTVACSAVTLGACIVEKHLTLARADGGPDAEFSLEPKEFTALVENVRIVEQALGRPGFGAGEREKGNLRYRRSLFVVEDVAEGETLTVRNVRSIRPADGLPPKHLREVLGRRAKRAIERGTPLRWEDID